MNRGSWYPTLVALADGRALSVSGAGNTTNEVFTAGGAWLPLSAAVFNRPLYPHLRPLRDESVFYSGMQFGARAL